MGETVIQVSSLGKRIKGKTILEDISFEINKEWESKVLNFR